MFPNQAMLSDVQRARLDRECLTAHGMRRRDVLRAMAASGMLTASGDVWAQTLQPKRGGTLRVATGSGAISDTLDPAKGTQGTDYVQTHMFYNGLTEFDANLGAQLALARSIEKRDSTIWIIKLRRDVQFHNGKLLTSADVVYSLLRHKNPAVASKIKPVADQFKEIVATSPDEVKITLVGPNADLPILLGDTHFYIVADGTSDFKTAVGTGPFKISEFSP